MILSQRCMLMYRRAILNFYVPAWGMPEWWTVRAPVCYQGSSIPVMRRLLNIGTVFVLVLNCWGSVLAALCPHACHPSPTVVADVRSHGSDANPVEHCHATMPDDEARQSPATFVQQATGVAEYAVDDTTGARLASVFDSALFSCDHCVGRGDLPPSAFTNREANQFKRHNAAGSIVVGVQGFHSNTAFVREIIPYEDGPPSHVHRHVLLSVFRI